jgi:hypothetical protein
VPDEKRGRIVSFYAASFLGVMPLGALAAGSLAETIGAPATATLFGACCVLLGTGLGAKLRSKRSR